MRVIVTRAEPGASDTLKRLAALGHDALAAPALRIEPIPGVASLAGVQAILFTSSNGVRTFAALSAERALPAFCVGAATADAARAAGFTGVRAADGDVDALTALAKAALSPEDGALLHAAGADVAGDLAGRLRSAGFAVRVHVCYRAVEATALPGVARDALMHSQIDAVLFHSARGAAAFVKQVNDTSVLARVDACCLSEAVADVARSVIWRSVCVATAPRERALLALLGPADFPADSGHDSADSTD